jgi:methanogenic corrinoid protein MtbC1
MIPSGPAELFLRAILSGDRVRAGEVATEALRGGIALFYRDVVAPAMEEIGRLWQDDRISVADEHMATAVAELAVAALYPSLTWPVGGPKAIVACVEGERHQFGVRMVADLLALDGWDVAFLGSDVPSEALLDMARRLRGPVVLLSMTLARHRAAGQRLIASLRRDTPGVRVIAGGRAVAQGHDPVDLGADAVGLDGEAAVRIAAAWKR